MGRWGERVGGCCPVCFAQWKDKPGNRKTYCSQECWRIARHPGWSTCEWCSEHFRNPSPSNRARGEGRYCSNACAGLGASWRSPVVRRVTLAVNDSRAVREMKRARAVCGECSRSYIMVAAHQVVCKDPGCRRAYALRQSRYTQVGVPVVYNCVDCGCSVTTENKPGAMPKRCEACRAQVARRRERKHRARLRQKGLWPSQSHRGRARRHGVEHENIKPADVYRRDKWMCGICGERIHKAKKYPHPDSPSVDCIVPMAKGGGFVMHNVQAAHWSCNVRKGDGAVGSQMRMAV